MRETRGNRQKAASLTLSDAHAQSFSDHDDDYYDDGNAAEYLDNRGFPQPQFGTKVEEQLLSDLITCTIGFVNCFLGVSFSIGVPALLL